MLSHKVLTRVDLNEAGRYYADAGDDYYTKDLDSSAWHGKGAEQLGLQGEVERGRFQQLLAGQVKPGIEITRSAIRDDAKERIGIDLTFSAPKSVSIQALVGGDARIIKAHEEAVAETIKHAESLAQARVKVGGKSAVVDTGNLVVATFRHETSREQDPQLHTHAVVLNVTKRGDGQWRALRNDNIVKSVTYLGAHYRAELATRLHAMGYELRHGRDGMFELGHISRDQLKAFSERSAAIEAALEAKGMDRASATGAEKQAATMQTRPKKEHADREELWQRWQDTAAKAGIELGAPEKVGGDREAGQRTVAAIDGHATAQAANKAVRYAVNHLTERQAVVKESQVIDVATKHGMGRVTVPAVREAMARLTEKGSLIREAPLYKSADDLRSALTRTREGWAEDLTAKGMARGQATAHVAGAISSGRLVVAEARFTTQGALALERSIANMEREGRGASRPVLDAETGKAKLAAAGTILNERQRNAATAMLASGNRVIGVQGLAGTGKTTMLSAAKALAEEQGYRMVAVAPYGSQVKALQAEGFEARTVMAFVRAKEKGLDEKTILVIDESGVMPTRLMERTLREAQAAGARVVLVGDTGQTKAIEAGKPFERLQATGMETIKLDEIIRQRDPQLKSAVEDAAIGKSTAALAKISDVAEIKDDNQRWAKIAADYMALPAAERGETLIVSGTNEARQAINTLVRENELRVGTGEQYNTLVRRDTTQAERQYAKNYRIGDVIQPERDYPGIGLERGQTYRVMDATPTNRLTVERVDGERVTFSPKVFNRLSVYEPERKELAAGDRVRITRNDAGLDVANGDRFTVKSANKTEIVLSDSKRELRLPADKPLHLDYAYASTVHSAQGLTSKNVFYEANSHSPTTSREVFYVAISRARERAAIYTNDASKLPAAVARPTQKHAAQELVRERQAGMAVAGRPAPAADLARTTADKARIERNQMDRTR